MDYPNLFSCFSIHFYFYYYFKNAALAIIVRCLCKCVLVPMEEITKSAIAGQKGILWMDTAKLSKNKKTAPINSAITGCKRALSLQPS